VQRDLGGNWNFQVGYVGNHMVRAAEFINMNAAGPGGGNNGTPLEQACTATPPPSFCNPTPGNPLGGNHSAFTINGPFSGGNYNALQSQLKRRVAQGQVGVVYTYSKTIDNDDTEANTNVNWAYYQALARDRALAGFDQKHNFQIYTVYASPFGKNQHWVTKGVGAALLGGWTADVNLTRDSGTPFTITTSSTFCNCPGNSTLSANQVEPNVKILGGHGPNSPYFDPLAFAAPAAPEAPSFGNAGRNTVRGPGLFAINGALIRNFDLTERFKLEFRCEAYGLTNTPNFANPGTNVSNAKFSGNTVTSYGGYDIITATIGPSWAPYGNIADRQIRFAMKLTF